MSTIVQDSNNVLYLRTDNPMTILTRGIADEDLRIECENVKLIKTGDYRYHAICNQLDNATITISDGKEYSQIFHFRVKRVPDPDLILGQRHFQGPIKANDFKHQLGFFFPRYLADCIPRCTLTTYDVTLVRGNDDAVSVRDTGLVFNARTLALMQTARRGDVFYFDNMRCRCPGDENRAIGSLKFKIW